MAAPDDAHETVFEPSDVNGLAVLGGMGVNPGESLDVCIPKKRASFRGQIRSLGRWLSEGGELAGWFDGGGWHAEVDACEIEEGTVAVQDGEFDLGGLSCAVTANGWPSNIGSSVQRSTRD